MIKRKLKWCLKDLNIGMGQEWQSTIPERLTSVHLAFYPATQKSTSQLGKNCDGMSIYLATTL